MDCLFCKIAAGEIPSTKVYEDEQVYAFLDIEPQAPVHIILIPKTHIPSANALTEENAGVVGHIYAVAAKLAKEQGFAEKGYRIVNNCGEDGGQTVGHIHFHLLAGRNLGWPPG
ncbi:MAG: histidine triad nucleotide-binding protein [Clostridia bacterium]|nr:histidine triad nucleotide-binding protein [Clostridia bacterium]